MKRYAVTTWPRFLTAALLALVAGAILAPASARASCGDYVTVTNPAVPNMGSSHSPAHPLPARPEQTTPGSRHVPDGDDTPYRLPCQGPGCSGMPLPAPSPVSTAVMGADQDQWDCLLTLPITAYAEADALQLNCHAARAVRRGQCVYHPPRPF